MFRIKICGIQTQDEEQMIGRSGADAVGLNFFRGSQRYLDNLARQEFKDPGPVGIHRIGVFVNESHNVIQQVCRSCHLTAVQLHGNETPEMAAELAPWKIVKAFQCDGEICQQVISFVEKCEQINSPLAAVLIDAAEQRFLWRVGAGRRLGFRPFDLREPDGSGDTRWGPRVSQRRIGDSTNKRIWGRRRHRSRAKRA